MVARICYSLACWERPEDGFSNMDNILHEAKVYDVTNFYN